MWRQRLYSGWWRATSQRMWATSQEVGTSSGKGKEMDFPLVPGKETQLYQLILNIWLPEIEDVKLDCFKPLSSWQFVIATLGNYYRYLKLWTVVILLWRSENEEWDLRGLLLSILQYYLKFFIMNLHSIFN